MPGEIQPSPSKLAHQAQDTSLAYEIQKRVCAFVFNHFLHRSQRKHRLTFNASSKTITMQIIHYIDSDEKKNSPIKVAHLCRIWDLSIWTISALLWVLRTSHFGKCGHLWKTALPNSKVTAQAKPLWSLWRFSIGRIVVWHKPTPLVVSCALCRLHMSCYTAFSLGDWEFENRWKKNNGATKNRHRILNAMKRMQRQNWFTDPLLIHPCSSLTSSVTGHTVGVLICDLWKGIL